MVVDGLGRKWTEEEIEFLKKNYEKEKPEKIAEALNRSLPSIYCEAQSLDLSSERCGSGRKWASEEERYLKENYASSYPQEFAKELNRSVNSVRHKAKDLNLESSRRGSGKKWTSDEKQFLIENIDKIPPIKIAEKLGRSRYSIWRKKKKLGLETPFSAIGRKWTTGETNYLVRNYREKTAEEIGNKLNRSPDSIHGKVKELGLESQRSGLGKVWNKREEEFLKSNYKNMAAEEIASKLGRSFHSVTGKAGRLGLRFREVPFDKSPSNELGYVLGVLYGDGCVAEYHGKSHSYHIILSVKDESFAQSFKEALEKIGLNPHIRMVTKRVENRILDMHRVEASSKLFCQWWNELTYPKVEKLLETKGMKQELIRGFYESEGTLHVRKGGRRPYITMAASEEKLVNWIKFLLEDLGYSPTFSQGEHKWNDRSWMMYHIRLSTSETQRFLKEINSVIPRKSLSSIETS